jgi:hypothetical protein
LNNEARGGRAIEATRLAQQVEQRPARSVFDDEVDVRAVREESEEAQDVRMAQLGLDLDFPAKLTLHRVVLKLRLAQNLDANNVFRVHLPRQIHVPEFAPTQRATDFEVFDAPAT